MFMCKYYFIQENRIISNYLSKSVFSLSVKIKRTTSSKQFNHFILTTSRAFFDCISYQLLYPGVLDTAPFAAAAASLCFLFTRKLCNHKHLVNKEYRIRVKFRARAIFTSKFEKSILRF